ncbi:MAG: OmpA family protein [Bacteroidota bacterium]
MRISAALVLLFMSISSGDLRSQSYSHPWSVGIHPSMIRFVSLNVDEVPGGKQYDFGVQFSFARYINNSFDVGIEGTFANLQHPSGLNELNEVQRDNFYAIQPFAKYKINNGYILPENLVVGPFLKAGLGINKASVEENTGVHIPLAVGVNFKLGKNSSLELQTTYNVGTQEGEDYFQSSIGLLVHFKKKIKKPFKNIESITDSDRDGIPDFKDKCPFLAGVPAGNGCPDQDGDGIFDDADECPDVAGFANLVGCVDSDKDGLIDPDDSCPHEYGDMTHEGCPYRALDTDKDRIIDSEDECPELPGLFTTNGCPDADGDGIRDSEDACPEEYGEAKDGGCPSFDIAAVPPTGPVVTPVTSYLPLEEEITCEKQYVFLEELAKQVLFETNSTNLSESSHEALDQIAQVMNACDVHKLLITAHTDSDGSPAYNMALSSERAYAVKAYLMRKGVRGDRLVTAPFGETSPLYPNNSDQNKGLNRRVEFTLFQ